jgi:hypothetical protein
LKGLSFHTAFLQLHHSMPLKSDVSDWPNAALAISSVKTIILMCRNAHAQEVMQLHALSIKK